MEIGFVKWFDDTRGFGFITDEATKKDVFFHWSETLDKVVAADWVKYSVEDGPRGPKAVSIRRIKNGR